MRKQRKNMAEKRTGKVIGQLAQIISECFIAAYSDDAEQIAKLALEKIRVSKKRGR